MTDVAALLDAEGSFATLRQAFGVDDDAPWRLPFHVFLARTPDATVLVDTGLGPPGEDPFLPERQGWLRGLLDPAAVDLVVLTHLHVDHVGWNMLDGAPFFPRARYVAQAADYAWITGTRAHRPYVRDQVVGLHASGRLELVDGDAEPLPGVTVRHVPGHTPGHSVVEIGDVTLLGDLAVHELQLADPGIAYVAEEDPAAAADARRRLLPGLAASGRMVGVPHLGLGRIRTAGAGFGWEPAG